MVTWRVGVLFSRSGATAVSETEHFFGTALAIEELNNAGGVLGRPIEPVVYDPTSDPLTYRRYAERLLGDDGVNVIFGCSTSSCRKAVLPVVERRNGLLWYPSLYEGFEYSPNVIYTGAAPNQNSFQLSEYLIQNGGRHFYFIGTDYIYPRESNRIMRDLVESRGGEVVGEKYLPMVAGDDDLKAVVADIAARKPDVVFATIVGQSARRFYRMYSDAGFDRRRRPVASLTMVEGEIAGHRRAILRRPYRICDLFQHARSAGEPVVRTKIPRALRPRCAGQHVVRNGLFAGPSVRQGFA